ncbi:MAG: hypothetical protein GXO07_05945 [Crenarchaeota archaeon]|nr:hypothetical protein [Thermoproteota archaeon]
MKDRATEMLENVEEECKKRSKNEEEYRKCLQEELKKLMESDEAKQLVKETLEEHI